jgi:hypothetical protein
VQATLFSVGAACIIAAIVGGGLRAFGVDFPALASIRRQTLLAAFGGFLMFVAGFSSPRTGEQSGTSAKSPAEATGFLALQTDLPAKIYVDGNPLGELEPGERKVKKLTAGVHTVKGTNIAGQYYFESESAITAGDQATLSIALTARKKSVFSHFKGVWSSPPVAGTCSIRGCLASCTIVVAITLDENPNGVLLSKVSETQHVPDGKCDEEPDIDDSLAMSSSLLSASDDEVKIRVDTDWQCRHGNCPRTWNVTLRPNGDFLEWIDAADRFKDELRTRLDAPLQLSRINQQ